MTVLGEICGLSEFLDGIHPIMFEVTSDKQSRYQWIRSTLAKFCYITLRKPGNTWFALGWIPHWSVRVS